MTRHCRARGADIDDESPRPVAGKGGGYINQGVPLPVAVKRGGAGGYLDQGPPHPVAGGGGGLHADSGRASDFCWLS